MKQIGDEIAPVEAGAVRRTEQAPLEFRHCRDNFLADDF